MMIILNLRASLPKMPCANYKAWLSPLCTSLYERMEHACILEGFWKKIYELPRLGGTNMCFSSIYNFKERFTKKRLPLDTENVFNNPRCSSAVFVPKPLPQNTFHPTAFGWFVFACIAAKTTKFCASHIKKTCSPNNSSSKNFNWFVFNLKLKL